MASPRAESPRTERRPKNVGVINPYALAEAIRGTEIDWSVEDPHKVLPETLGTAYEQLFDPKHDSPLYGPLKLNRQTLEMESTLEVEAVEAIPPPEVSERPTDAGEIVSDADQPPDRPQEVTEVLSGVSAGAVWRDKGMFFHEAAEFFDPVQGAVGDCYLIAAMSSVAWAMTYEISHRSRATGVTQEQFVDMIPFFDGARKMVEVTEKVPVNAAGNFIYARSLEPGEVWPAVYEKAYAKWRTHHTGDTPNILNIAGGDPVGAAAQLTGLSPFYYWTASLNADAIYTRIRENSLSRKTFNPMVAWTYPSGDKSPDKVNYGDANLVANHAYSILGWDYRHATKYVILRNPWGRTEAKTDILTGNWSAWDAPYYGGPGWWRTIYLGANDGIFGLRVETFKKFFAGFGVAKRA